MTTVSKKSIRRLGTKIREEIDKPSKEVIQELEDYRISFKSCVKSISTVLNEQARSVRVDSITTYRIKRIESIIGKLKRYPMMKLDTMGDIAGCRCVLNNSASVIRLLSLLQENLEIKKINNYYEKKLDSGYRSIHLYVTEINGDTRPIEIQIRSRNDHNWATLVEIIDALYGKNIKEGQSSPQFDEFLKMMSVLDDLDSDKKIDLINLIHKIGLFNKLFSVFIQNYLTVRLQWLEVNKAKKHHYFVIEVGSENKPEILSYNNFTEAEEEYFKRFIEKKGSNIVLTYLPQANFDNLETAYANYTLTTHSFIDEYFKLIGEVCVALIRKKELWKYYNTYTHFLSHLQKNFQMIVKEIDTIISVGSNDPSKVKYWKKDFQKRLDKRVKQSRNIQKRINNIKPRNGLLYYQYIFINKLINRKKKKILKNGFVLD